MAIGPWNVYAAVPDFSDPSLGICLYKIVPVEHFVEPGVK